MKKIGVFILFLVIGVSLFSQPKSIYGGVDCGWSCDPDGPHCKPNKAGDTYQWIGWCDHYHRGICTDRCVGTLNGNVSCNGQTYWLSCPSFTKTSTGCCNTDRPPAPPTPTPTPLPPQCLSLTAQPQSGRSPLTVTFTARAKNRGAGIAAYEWDFDGQPGWDWTRNNTSTSDRISHQYPAGNYTIKVHIKDRRGYWSNVCSTNIAVTPRVTPTPTSIPTPTPTPRPTATPTPLPTPTPSPTPTPTPIPRWRLIDGQAHSANGFPRSTIINQNLPPLITYQTPLSYTRSEEEPIIEGNIFEKGNYTNFLQNSFFSDFHSLSQHLNFQITLKGKEIFTSQELKQAINLSHQNKGVIFIDGNLNLNQSKDIFRHFLFLVRGKTELTTNISPPKENFIISQGPLKITSNVSHLRGVFISYSKIDSQATTLQLQGGIIAKNSISFSPDNGDYTIQPDNELLFDLVTSPFFTNKNFRIFYLQERSPQL